MDYQLLPVDDDGRRAKSRTVDESTGDSRLSWTALIVCLLCTFVNAFLTLRSTSVLPYTFPSATSFLTTRGMSRKDIDSLRRPSQFIGLDQIPLNSTTTVPRSFVNFPLLMAQANAERPYEVNKPQSGEWSPIGTVYPELGEMVVTSSVSSPSIPQISSELTVFARSLLLYSSEHSIMAWNVASSASISLQKNHRALSFYQPLPSKSITSHNPVVFIPSPCPMRNDPSEITSSENRSYGGIAPGIITFPV